MSITEVPSTSPPDTPSINNSTSHSKAKFTIRSLVGHFKAKCSISKPKPKPKPLENNDQNAASSSTTTNNNENQGGDLALSKLIGQDMNFMKAAVEEAMKHMEQVKVQINEASKKHEEMIENKKYEELHKLKKTVTKLKSQIPSRLKTRSTDSTVHWRPWGDVNKSDNEIMHLYEVPKLEVTTTSEGLLKAFFDLPIQIQHCLFHFFLFPTMEFVKKRVMVYLWMTDPYLMMWKIDEDLGNDIFDELLAKGFIEHIDEPVNVKCSLLPDSCRMSLFARSALTTKVNWYDILPNYPPNRFFIGCRRWYSWLINVSEDIIEGGPELFEKMNHINILYLGRWQRHSEAAHHIELADTKILYGLRNMRSLTFLSLRGISLITELPSLISELSSLRILDLRACHNLEAIPEGIGLLNQLTHLDMSECYFLEYIPKSLSNLSNLEVLKGFFIGNSKFDNSSCTLDDLSGLPALRKLNIYTSAIDFPTEKHLNALQKFGALKKLTISWGGCSSVESLATDVKHKGIKRFLTSKSVKLPQTLPLMLHKLDLQCFRGTSPPSWLRPANLKELKKLYIRGGQLCDLGKFQNLNEEDQWTVDTLCLKYLSELEMDWEDLKKLFPKLVYLHIFKCPKLTKFPFEENVGWMDIKNGKQSQ